MSFSVKRPTGLTAADIAELQAAPIPPLRAVPDGILELFALLNVSVHWNNHIMHWEFCHLDHWWRISPEYLRTWEDWTGALTDVKARIAEIYTEKSGL